MVTRVYTHTHTPTPHTRSAPLPTHTFTAVSPDCSPLPPVRSYPTPPPGTNSLPPLPLPHLIVLPGAHATCRTYPVYFHYCHHLPPTDVLRLPHHAPTAFGLHSHHTFVALCPTYPPSVAAHCHWTYLPGLPPFGPTTALVIPHYITTRTFNATRFRSRWTRLRRWRLLRTPTYHLAFVVRTPPPHALTPRLHLPYSPTVYVRLLIRFLPTRSTTLFPFRFLAYPHV